MNITDLNITEICEKIKEYLPSFIQENFYFQESYLLGFEEFKDSIAEEYHKYFNDDSIYNHICGGYDTDDFDYVPILITSEQNTTAYLLVMQKISNATGNMEIIILKNFME